MLEADFVGLEYLFLERKLLGPHHFAHRRPVEAAALDAAVESEVRQQVIVDLPVEPYLGRPQALVVIGEVAGRIPVKYGHESGGFSGGQEISWPAGRPGFVQVDVVDIFILVDPAEAGGQRQLGRQVELGLGEHRIRIRILSPEPGQDEDARSMRRGLHAAGLG